VRTSAIGARRLAIRHIRATNRRNVQSALWKATVIVNVSRERQSVYPVEDPTSHIAETAGSFIPLLIHRTLKIFQLNLRKKREVQQSVMNDDQLQDFGILALCEPYAFSLDDRVITVLLAHTH
jgi:hypothetical protein